MLATMCEQYGTRYARHHVQAVCKLLAYMCEQDICFIVILTVAFLLKQTRVP